MSVEESHQPNAEDISPDTRDAETQGTAPLPLPAPSDASTSDAQKLDINEQVSALKFDALGPMVVNSDGTLSRITNWEEMQPIERERTMRVLFQRNRLRLTEQQEKQATNPSDEALGLASEQNKQS